LGSQARGADPAEFTHNIGIAAVRDVSRLSPPAVLVNEPLERASRLAPKAPVPNVAVTYREIGTLLVLAEGLGNQETARRLNVPSHGPKRLVSRVLLKRRA
jgi:DNA-binding NarL/FixJ family response regulator